MLGSNMERSCPPWPHFTWPPFSPPMHTANCEHYVYLGSIYGILPGRAASCTDESGDVNDRLHQMVQLTRADVPIAY